MIKALAIFWLAFAVLVTIKAAVKHTNRHFWQGFGYTLGWIFGFVATIAAAVYVLG